MKKFQHSQLHDALTGINEDPLSQSSDIHQETLNQIDPVPKKRKRSISCGSGSNKKVGKRNKSSPKKKRSESTSSRKKSNDLIEIDLTSSSDQIIEIPSTDAPIVSVVERLDTAMESKKMNDLMDKDSSDLQVDENGTNSTETMSNKNNNIDILLKAAESSNRDVAIEIEKLPPDFSDDQAIELIQHIKEIAKNDPTAASFFGIPISEHVEISPGYFAFIPTLPEEPEFDESKRKLIVDSNNMGHQPTQPTQPVEIPKDVKVPTLLPTTKKEPKIGYDVQIVDTWFPTCASIRRERKVQGVDSNEREVTLETLNGEVINISDELSNRLKNEVEPGVLEKLPHCKLHYESFLRQFGRLPKEPVFCCQVTETYCKSTMICCSICSTWRHSECGGHHKHYSPNSSEEEFTPVCDRCHTEEKVLEHFPLAIRRLSRQRSIRLRAVHAVTAIMRNCAYSKHGGTYKWPLGSVSPYNIGSHTKSIHLRHERSEKQWKEMAAKLNGISNTKSSKAKSRTRDFERLMVNLEDAGKSLTFLITIICTLHIFI